MEKYEDNDTAITDKEKKELKENIEKLRKCTCLKNFDRFKKSMESNTIARLVSDAPRFLNSYIRIIIMDDDTKTCNNLQEDHCEERPIRCS